MNKNEFLNLRGLESIGGDIERQRALYGLGRIAARLQPPKEEAPVAELELFDWDTQSFELSYELERAELEAAELERAEQTPDSTAPVDADNETSHPVLALVVESSHKGFFDERHPTVVANLLQEQPRQ